MGNKTNTARPDKIIGRAGSKPGNGAGKTTSGKTKSVKGETQSTSVAKRVYGSDYEKYTTKQGYVAWRKKTGKTGKKALPLDKSKKKGSPRSSENLKKSKPVDKGKKGKKAS